MQRVLATSDLTKLAVLRSGEQRKTAAALPGFVWQVPSVGFAETH